MIGVIDCGLSSLKVSLFDETGVQKEVATETYPTRHDGERAEQDPLDWWRALVAVTRRLELRAQIRMLVPTGHMHGLVLLDERHRPLLPCLTLHDRRGAADTAMLDALSFYESTGEVLDPALPIAKLLWLRRVNPEVHARAAALLAPKDYLRLRLTGELQTDHIDAAGTGLYELSTRKWSSELADLAGLTEDILPPVLESTDVAGELSGDAAEQLGLRPGIPVLVGAGDDIELLGATGHRQGIGVEHVGTTGSVLAVVMTPHLDPAGRVEVYPTAAAGTLAAGASTSNAGSVVQWVEQTLGVPLMRALEARPGNLVALPYLFGERSNLGVPFASGALIGLDGTATLDQMAHALLSGVAFGIRELLHSVADLAGELSGLVSSGGGARSVDWVQLRANAYGISLHLLDGDATARGCLALALAAMGGLGVEEAARRLPQPSVIIDPDPHSAEELHERFLRFVELRQALQHIDPTMKPPSAVPLVP